MQILTLTEDVHNIKPAIELNYSYTDDPEYKRKVRDKQIILARNYLFNVVYHHIFIWYMCVD